MSDPIPEIAVPGAASRFNIPSGAGLVTWFAELAASISVSLVENRGAAAIDAAQQANVARIAAAQFTTETAAETLAAAERFTTETVNTSHLDRDTDGTPYFRQGSMTLSIYADSDGNPFFLDN